MSTNRTKIDWAYKAAERIVKQICYRPADPPDVNNYIRMLAALLRRQYRRGVEHGMDQVPPW